MRGTPFRLAIAMMATISNAMALPIHFRQQALAAIGPYKSRGKGGKSPHRSVGTKAYQRAAAKLRNQRKVRHG